MKSLLQFLGFCVIVGGTFWFGYKCGKVANKYPEPLTPPVKIRSIGETQQQLRDAGYNIKVDYLWGPETEKAYCDWKLKQVWPKE